VSAHTPGPWTVGYLRIEGRADIYADSEPTSIASVREANAALVAAAPELLEALKVVLPYAKSLPYFSKPCAAAVEQAEAAIAKAEGES